MKSASLERSKKLIKVLTYAFLALGTIVMIFPFIWMILTSSKTVPESMQMPAAIGPQECTRRNFSDVMKRRPVVKG